MMRKRNAIEMTSAAASAIGLFVVMCGVAHAASASYSFTQGGWTGGTLTGQFSGNQEPNGMIDLVDLTSFTATFDDSGGTPAGTFVFNQANLEAFSFNTADNGSLEFAAGFNPSSIVLCSGATETPSVCDTPPPAVSGSGASVPYEGYFVSVPDFGPFTTITASVATQTSIGINPTPALAPVPEPGTAPLLSAIAGLLVVFGSLRRHTVARVKNRLSK